MSRLGASSSTSHSVGTLVAVAVAVWVAFVERDQRTRPGIGLGWN